MTGPMAADSTKNFYSLGSRVLGGIGVVLALVVVGVAAVDRTSGIADWLVALMVLLAVLIWCAMIRQSVALDRTTLTLRGMFRTVSVPLVSVQGVATSQVMVITADGKRYVSAALGRTRREQRRDDRRTSDSGRGIAGGLISMPLAAHFNDEGTTNAGLKPTYESLVEEQIRTARDLARNDRGSGPAGEVVVRRAWPEIVITAVSAVVTVILLVL